MFGPFRRVERQDLVVIDSQFPQKEPFAFRNTETNEYFKLIKNFSSYAMSPMLPGPEAWFPEGYGISYQTYLENKAGYLKHYPENEHRIHYLHQNRRYRFKLAYSYFLGETYVLLPFYEKHKIPFIFTLYPGGRFGVDHTESDKMLQRIFQSPYFREVIVTQDITRQYLEDKQLCPPDKISYIYGGFVQFRPTDLKPKKRYPQDKATFDVCFVAAKYTERGVDKGYDLFIEVAKRLCGKLPNIRFHVVGGFGPDDIDVSDINGQIIFYGYQKPDFLLDFYAQMDVFLSPNRPRQITPWNFDGFPLGIDAGYCGVAMFVADELKMNHHFKDGHDLVIIPLDAGKIANAVVNYYNNPDALYALSSRGQAKFHELFDVNRQIKARLAVYQKHIDLELAN